MLLLYGIDESTVILIKQLENNKRIVFDKSRFDNWCVYLVDTSNRKTALRDEIYFLELKRIANYYSNNKIYTDFIKIYSVTNQKINTHVLILIDKIAKTYAVEHQRDIEQWFTIIYGGMVAEENKQNTILKKRVKHLGMYQVFILNMSVSDAARFSNGKKWRELDKLMENYGF